MDNIKIKLVNYNEEIAAIQNIRKIVFQEEQNVPEDLEFDGEDETSQHLLAYLDEQPVGTARIIKVDNQQAKIGRLAVLSVARGKGIGTKLMEEALLYLTNNNYKTVTIHAQEYVKPLYEKIGFQQVGNSFLEVDIPHIKMIKQLQG